MKSMVIDFNEDGTVQAQHRDSFPLGFLGKQEIVRASEIVFNDETQLWDLSVRNAEGSFIQPQNGAAIAGYDLARQIEVEWLDACRMASVYPLSSEGEARLQYIRILKESAHAQ